MNAAETLNAWITSERRAGRWVSLCPECLSVFTQPRAGRRAEICGAPFCRILARYRGIYGRKPEAEKLKAMFERFQARGRTARNGDVAVKERRQNFEGSLATVHTKGGC